MRMWKAARRRLRFVGSGGGGWAAGRRRRRVVAVSMAVSLATVLLSFASAYPVSVWLLLPFAASSSYSTVASLSSSAVGAGGDSSLEESLVLPLNSPPLPPHSSSVRQYQEPKAFVSTPPSSPSIANWSSLDGNSDDDDVEDSGAALRLPPLRGESVHASNSTDSSATTVPAPFVAPPPSISKSDAVQVNSSRAEPKVPPLLPEVHVSAEDFLVS